MKKTILIFLFLFSSCALLFSQSEINTKVSQIDTIPAAPILISPPNGSGTTLTPLMDWSDVPNADSYEIRFYTDSLLNQFWWSSSGITSSQITIPSGVLMGFQKYYWRVNASNSSGTGPSSTIWHFTTGQNLTLNLKAYLEGFWNGTTHVRDTISIYLQQSTAPFSLKDSTNVYFNTDGTSVSTFTNALNGNYYIVVRHLNHFETTSSVALAFTSGVPVNYDFTTDSSKARGHNMKKAGNKWVFYGGDPNGDGSIDGKDINLFEIYLPMPIHNDPRFDFNGDGSFDALDVQILVSNYGLTKAW
jgi:hypothetical protein